MHKFLFISFIILFYSCGDDSSTNPPSIDYHTDDQQFIDDLASANGTINAEAITERITTATIDSGSIRYYRIEKLHLGNIGLDSIPSSIGNLVSLNVLMLNDNNLKFLTESICTIYDQLDSLDVTNNSICTPDVPDCIVKTQNITVFYNNQQCAIMPDEDDMKFIADIITVNWGDTASIELINDLNNLTSWETFAEDNFITSRITEIRYDNKGIKTIPQSIGDLDSLEHLELQKNQITIMPSYIGNLSRLKYFHIFDNHIEKLPAKIGNLSNLEVFKIYENNLEEIHSHIGGLTKLITLWLSENQLTSLPDSMCNILTNPGIDINIDNNKICNNNYHECFNNLVNYSEGQDCP